MFQKLLVANRGEIAVRIMRTCREMGIRTVAVYSEVDRDAPHVLQADEAVCLGPAAPAESYLAMDRILSAARETGAEAIHPGYGFLAENAAFAEACRDASVVFVGPPPEVIGSLGDKTEARRIMTEAGVPVIPGMLEPSEDPEALQEEADAMGYPVLLKAPAGGGGKGMRVVAAREAMLDAARAAMREAKGAFGDGRLYVEKLLVAPRHVEVQILADSHGQVVHLFERECSIQRRHQKIVEESPSVALGEELRAEMGASAVAAAKAAGYVNAGTVEFLLDGEGRYYFLEVNTRLQVEHPVTELRLGLDLVRLQLEVADGGKLPFTQADLVPRGHAIECRIYAEDPAKGFVPSPGLLRCHRPPEGPGIRNDCGVREGGEVPVHYDPILSKLIAFGPTREAARQRMVRALRSYVVLGVMTTIPFLVDVLESAPFREGATTTDFVERHFASWEMPDGGLQAAITAYLADERSPAAVATVASAPGKEGHPTPWETLGPWRM